MIVGAGELRQPPGHEYVRPAGLPVWTLVHYASGRMRFQTEGRDEEAEFGRDTLVLIPAFVPYREYAPTPVDEIYVHFQPREAIVPFLDWPEALPGLMSVSLCEHLSLRTDVHAALRETVRFRRRGLPETTLLAENALEKAVLLAHLLSPTRAPTALDPRIGKAIAFISDRCTTALTVARVAQHVSMSASHFAHCFREQTGMAPAAFVEHQRIERVKDLLLHTNLMMKEIAARTGFANACHFSFRFHKHTGQKPSMFRVTAGGHPEMIGEQRGHG